MTLKECMFIKNSCYLKNQKMTGNKPTGIVVHSTGANNKTLKRYVQPVAGQSYYDAVIADIGKNKYGNHWNRSADAMGRSVCVHAFIGANAAGKVETYQVLPFDVCCWGVGSGTKGSYNYNPQARVQFEMCEDGLSDATYFNAVMKEAQEFCAFLCKKYGFGVDKISSHLESYLAGYGGNHGDPHNWLKPFGKTMDWFRAEVQKLLDASNAPIVTPPAPTVTNSAVKKGDLVKIASNATYYSGKAVPSWVKNQNWYVREISGNRAVIDKNEKGTNAICSPINAQFLTVVKAGAAVVNWTPAVGDIVNFNGTKHYTSANGSTGFTCKGGKAKITAIYQLGKSKHPYHLVRVSGSGASVYGWVDVGTFTKA